MKRLVRNCGGFTLLEVLVAMAILGIGAALTMSLISGSMGNIRKVQMRTKIIQHAETVMELSLLDDKIKGPTTLTGDFEDGTRWAMVVENFEIPSTRPLTTQQVPMPVKMLSYSVAVYGPNSRSPDFQLHTLKTIGNPSYGASGGSLK